MDDKGQMMALEAVLFAITVILALIFLYQLSPSSIVSDKSTNTLKIQGDDALQTLYEDVVTDETIPKGFPENKLIYYLITNAYKSPGNDDLKDELSKMIPSAVYNVYISNESKKIYLFNSFGDTASDSAIKLDEKPVTISHMIISIHPQFLNLKLLDYPNLYKNTIKDESWLYDKFYNSTILTYPYDGCSFDLILEMM